MVVVVVVVGLVVVVVVGLVVVVVVVGLVVVVVVVVVLVFFHQLPQLPQLPAWAEKALVIARSTAVWRSVVVTREGLEVCIKVFIGREFRRDLAQQEVNT